ncbi:MAG: hypothetical protein ACK56F_04085 [bacterium]
MWVPSASVSLLRAARPDNCSVARWRQVRRNFFATSPFKSRVRSILYRHGRGKTGRLCQLPCRV